MYLVMYLMAGCIIISQNPEQIDNSYNGTFFKQHTVFELKFYPVFWSSLVAEKGAAKEEREGGSWRRLTNNPD